ncbi:ABC transporter ATP-binding protein [Acidovorax facilis]|jgi:ABC-type branched-subunit amino acid transport system ATPase component|uniref:ABC transporter ATP-binding protein n=1 Tax=Acidovorax facilis TaxID=12917 RepID=UPI003D65B672
MTINVKGVTVRFGGVVALKDVSIQLERGRVQGVIGPNGSGKSTLFNAITGMVKPSAGSVSVDGVALDTLPPHRRINLGLARTFQTPRFDPHITVHEAVMCGFYPVHRAGMLGAMFRLPQAAKEENGFRRRCDEILREMKLDDYRDLRMSELPMGRVRLVEVARALANDPKYLLLDEPAAGLAQDEQSMLTSEVRRLAKQGVGVLLVEHNFRMVRELVEQVLVLKEGVRLIEGTPESVSRDPAFVEAYLGSAGK